MIALHGVLLMETKAGTRDEGRPAPWRCYSLKTESEEMTMNGQACPIEKVDRLLVATDGTKSSGGALREAINLAKVSKIL